MNNTIPGTCRCPNTAIEISPGPLSVHLWAPQDLLPSGLVPACYHTHNKLCLISNKFEGGEPSLAGMCLVLPWYIAP